MSDWRQRAEMMSDVVSFEYVARELMNEQREVFVWDLDKTYLDTRWGSLKELIQTAFEKAFQKRNVPGTGSLMRALKASWQKDSGQRSFPVYFITASPPQLEEKIIEKLKLDGIFPFGCFFKDNLRNLQPKKWFRLTQQVGYKLQALMQLRLLLKDNVRQVMWGDDSESDAVIYSLYSDICSRRLSPKEIKTILKGFHVLTDQIELILKLQTKIVDWDPVEKIYINLAVDTDPDYYLKFGRRVVPTANTFQQSLDLYQDRRLTVEQVIRVGQDMMMNYGYTSEQLEQGLDDLIRRSILGAPVVTELVSVLAAHKIISPHFEPSVAPKEIQSQVGDRVFELEGEHEPWVPERIDYLHDYR